MYQNQCGKANCIADETGVLTVSSRQLSKKPTNMASEPNDENEVEWNYADIYDAINEEVGQFDNHLNAYMANIVESNIFLVLKHNHKAECSDCMQVFQENAKINDSFIHKKLETNPNNQLHQPCTSTVTIIKVINYISKLLSQGRSFHYISQTVLTHIPIDELFDRSNFEGHTYMQGQLSHKEEFIRKIIENYLKIKAEKIGIRISEEERGEYIRHKNKKNTHNAGQ